MLVFFVLVIRTIYTEEYLSNFFFYRKGGKKGTFKERIMYIPLDLFTIMRIMLIGFLYNQYNCEFLFEINSTVCSSLQLNQTFILTVGEYVKSNRSYVMQDTLLLYLIYELIDF